MRHISPLCQAIGRCRVYKLFARWYLHNNMLQLEQYTGMDYRQILEKAVDFISNVKCFNYTLGDHHQAIPLHGNCQSVIKMLHSRAVSSPSYTNITRILVLLIYHTHMHCGLWVWPGLSMYCTHSDPELDSNHYCYEIQLSSHHNFIVFILACRN